MTAAPACPSSPSHPVIWADLAITCPGRPVWWCCTCRAVIADAPPATRSQP